jgi:CheY-like chemotaxis protein
MPVAALPPRKILVVDDDMDVAQSLATLVRDMGYPVEFAINGYFALEVAWRLKPEVIFLDPGLPDMDGWELAREFRRCPGLQTVYIAIVTEDDTEEDRQRSATAGCQVHLVKPLDLKIVESLLARRRLPAAA